MSDSRVGPFVLERSLASRAMGEIWAAVHEPSGTPAALKFLARKHATDPRAVAAFRAEARALATVEHPGVVRIHHYGIAEGGVPFFAMERAPGGSLAELGARDDVTAILLSLLDALAHVHARGLIHRDLTPGNVLVWRMPGPPTRWGAYVPGVLSKIADFGLATSIGNVEPPPARARGTPQYMAPEQFAKELRDEGPWTDLYALGCIATRLVTGKPPFAGRSWKDLELAHRTMDPPAVEGRLGAWLARLLAKEPRDRFRSAADAAWALVRSPDSSTAPPMPERWGEPEAARLPLEDTSLSLLEVERVPVPPDRDAVWTTLVGVRASGRARVVSLSTDEARWLCERATELGSAWVLRGGNARDVLVRAFGTDGLGEVDATERVERQLGDEDRDDLEALVLVEAMGLVHDRAGDALQALLLWVRTLAKDRPVIVWMADGAARLGALVGAAPVLLLETR
jgi:hypothetical protein